MLVDVQDLVRPLRLLAIDRLFPDRDVRAAVGGERLAVPATPAVTQPESGEPGHQVEFGGPHPSGSSTGCNLTRTALLRPFIFARQATVHPNSPVTSPRQTVGSVRPATGAYAPGLSSVPPRWGLILQCRQLGRRC